MTAGWVNLTVPRGNERELVGHGELGFIPWRTVDAAGRVVWLVRVPPHVVPYLTRGPGFWPAADELQSAQPPSPPIRGVNAVPVTF
jgi:hypothetical protein